MFLNEELGIRNCHAGCKHCVSLTVNCQLSIVNLLNGSGGVDMERLKRLNG